MMDSVINNPLIIKAGTITAWGSSIIPYGWLLCDGSQISRTTYKALFNAIGTNYGSGDGTTTFNLPNGRIPVGNAKVKGTGMTLGFTNGAKNTGIFSSSAGSAMRESAFNIPVTSSGASGSNLAGDWGITTDETKSGLILHTDDQSRAIIKY